jgi:hypothetical protein
VITATERQDIVAAAMKAQEAVRPGFAIVRSWRKEEPRIFDMFEADLRREFELLAALVGQATREEGGMILEAATSRLRPPVSTEAEMRIEAILKRVAIDEWKRLRLRPLYEYHYKEVIEAMARIMNKHDVPITLRQELEHQVLQTGGTRAESLLDITQSVREALFNALDEGRQLGVNPKEMATVVEHWIPKGKFRYAGSSYRARLIARTETMYAQRYGSIQMYRSSPSVNQCVAMDGDEDELCAARNGEYFSFDEAELEADNEHPNGTLCFGPVT